MNLLKKLLTIPNILLLIKVIFLINNELFLKAKHTVDLLKQNGLKIATAESCTGGMLSAYITSVAGVSDIFEMGLCSYSCRIKNEILGVSKETLDKYGAVSENIAREMAEHIITISGADIGVSVTGVAGPDSSEGHPMGYVFIALADKNITKTKLLNIKPISRNFVRESAVTEIFNLINDYISQSI